MLIKCKLCENCFNATPSQLNLGKKYCSRYCYGKSRVRLDLPLLTSEQSSVVNGILLSDGGMDKQKKITTNSCLRLKQVKLGYLESVNKLLMPHIAAIDKGKSAKITGARYVDGVRKLEHSDTEFTVYYSLRSCSHPLWTDLRHKWYPDGKKIVPADIELNGLTMAHWYMGDGSYTHSLRSAYFATDSFSSNCIDLLRSKLHEIGLKNFIVLHYNLPRIYISRTCYLDFMDVIRPYMCECFSYKLA